MKRIHFSRTMTDAISEVFETMFFMSIEVVDAAEAAAQWVLQEASLTGARLDFSGPVSGTFYLALPSRFSDELTANFLGVDKEEISQAQRSDTVKEAMNMIGGRTLSLMQKADDFKLGLPRMIPTAEDLDKVFQGDDAMPLLVDAGKNRLAMAIVIP